MKLNKEDLPPLPEIICSECKTRDTTKFKTAYYIPVGGNLPEGWVIVCESCQEAFGTVIKSIGRSFCTDTNCKECNE